MHSSSLRRHRAGIATTHTRAGVALSRINSQVDLAVTNHTGRVASVSISVSVGVSDNHTIYHTAIYELLLRRSAVGEEHTTRHSAEAQAGQPCALGLVLDKVVRTRLE